MAVATVDLRADLIKIWKEGGFADLQLLNSTSGNAGWILADSGDGTLEFIAPPSGPALTAQNGIHLDGTVLKLGTTLTENTVIAGGGFNLDFGTSGSPLNLLSVHGLSHFSDHVRITDGTEGFARVFACDVSGNGTWQDAATVVIASLGYTPYSDANPVGYITGIDAGMVVSAIGYTPYPDSNPAGYITISDLPNFDAVLSLGGSFSTDRSADLSTFALTFVGGATTYGKIFNNGNLSWGNATDYGAILNAARTGTGNTVLDGIYAINTGTSTSVNKQYGPAYYSVGASFVTTSKESGIRWYNKTSAVAGFQVNTLIFESNRDGGAYTQFGQFTDGNGSASFSTATMIATTRVSAPITEASSILQMITNGSWSNLSKGQRVGFGTTAVTTTLGVDNYIMVTTSPVTVNLPAVSSVPYGVYIICNTSSGTTTVAANSTETIGDGSISANTYSLTQGHSITIISANGSSNWLIISSH